MDACHGAVARSRAALGGAERTKRLRNTKVFAFSAVVIIFAFMPPPFAPRAANGARIPCKAPRRGCVR